MPTAFPRSQVTHTPRVQRILKAGASRHPGVSSSELLVRLAEERVDDFGSNNELHSLTDFPFISAPGHHLTSQMVQDALNEE